MISDAHNLSASKSYIKPSRFLSTLDSMFWCFYLALLVVISFANSPIYSTYWLLIGAFIFLYAGLYCGFTCWLLRPRLKALYAARFALIWLTLMLMWMLAQQVFGKTSYLQSLLFDHSIHADWFHYSGLWSVTPERTWWGMLSNVVVAVLFLITLLLLDTRQRVKQLMLVLLVVGLTHIGIAIFAKYAGLYFIDKASLDGHYEAARGLFVNRNHLAAFCVLCLLPVIAIQIKLLMNNDAHRLTTFLRTQIFRWSFLFFLVGFVCVLLAESRAALLSLIVSLIFYISVLFNKSGASASLNKQYKFYVFSLLGIGFIVMMFVGQGMIERFVNNGLTIGERSTQWAITWQAIKHEFLLGYGVGSYELVFQTFRGDAQLRTVIYDQAHNDYLHIFLEQGVVGLFLWLSFIVSAIYYTVRAYQNSNSTFVCAVLLAGLIVTSAVLLQSLVDYPLQILTIRSYFFIMIAVLFAVPTVRHR